MKLEKHSLFIFLLSLFTFVSFSQTKQKNFYTVKRTVYTDEYRRSHVNLDIKFLNKKHESFTGPIYFKYNKDEQMINPDSLGIYNIGMWPGNYQFSFKNGSDKELVTDSVTLDRKENVEITVILKTKKRK